MDISQSGRLAKIITENQLQKVVEEKNRHHVLYSF